MNVTTASNRSNYNRLSNTHEISRWWLTMSTHYITEGMFETDQTTELSIYYCHVRRTRNSMRRHRSWWGMKIYTHRKCHLHGVIITVRRMVTLKKSDGGWSSWISTGCGLKAIIRRRMTINVVQFVLIFVIFHYRTEQKSKRRTSAYKITDVILSTFQIKTLFLHART